jgi:uncharacterized protein YcbK (DUF882 family)
MTTTRVSALVRLVRLVSLVSLVCLVSYAAPASADVTHVVQRGHTIGGIARRYHVTEKAIIDANHLSDPKHLKPGQALVIPGVDAAKQKRAPQDTPEKRERGSTTVSHVRPAHPIAAAVVTPAEPRGHAERDTIHAVRRGEDFHVRVRDTRGHVPPSALDAFERLMRQGNATHPVDPRLVTLVGIVSNHFDGATIEVVSGYRAYKPTQYTPHSNHNEGKALDFRIRGVDDAAVRDFCRTLRSAGCGYYPNDTFVHLDVRDTKAYWVDLSRSGEAPRYESSRTRHVDADEVTSDVSDDRAETAPTPAPVPESTDTQPAPTGSTTVKSP